MSGIFGSAAIAVPAHKSVEWYTPTWVFDAIGLTFDLDPASPHDHETAVPAKTKYTVFDDGLKKPWFGRVWMNPPYGPDTGMWVKRMAQHGNGIALVFSRTDASWCQEAMRAASAMLFMSGRIEFVPGKENKHKKARCGAGTVLFAFGAECANALRRLGDRGVFIEAPGDRLSGLQEKATMNHELKAEPEAVPATDDQKAAAYYKAGMLKQAPPWVPARVRVPREQFGDAPFRGAGVAAGEHECTCNRWGAVSVIDREGAGLGLRLDEFEPVAWRENVPASTNA